MLVSKRGVNVYGPGATVRQWVKDRVYAHLKRMAQ